ncbi:hypothetical protein [Streptomyces klenkii]
MKTKKKPISAAKNRKPMISPVVEGNLAEQDHLEQRGAVGTALPDMGVGEQGEHRNGHDHGYVRPRQPPRSRPLSGGVHHQQQHRRRHEHAAQHAHPLRVFLVFCTKSAATTRVAMPTGMFTRKIEEATRPLADTTTALLAYRPKTHGN